MKGPVSADICQDFLKKTIFEIFSYYNNNSESTGLGTAADGENVRVSNKDLRSYQ